MNDEEVKQKVREFFGFRCLLCFKPAWTVHEIIPRSAGKKALEFDNRVVLCNDCHDKVHSKMSHYIPLLQEKRKKFVNDQSNC